MQQPEENNMTAHDQWKQSTNDPLGLRDLEAIEPGYDGWADIESALLTHQDSKRSWQRAGRWLAVAASLVIVVSFTMRTFEGPATIKPEFASDINVGASSSAARDTDNVGALIGLSQNMENQVKQLRQGTSSMPAESAIYIAELEDLIAQVDNELSFTPGSIDLWGQRVNLLLDLAQIYQQQWQIDYGRMAAL
jgi:hypothetical protein